MAKIIDGTSYLTVDEAAERLATTTVRVLMLMRAQGLVGVQLEGEWLVVADSLSGCLIKGFQTSTANGCASSCASARGCAARHPGPKGENT